MTERTGLKYPESIDKVSVSSEPDDGFYRLSIGQFENWEFIENACDRLREKVEYYISAIRGNSLHKQFPEIKGRTGRITLMTYEPLPKNIEVLFGKLRIAAQSHGVQLDHWIIERTR